jgi:uncharacterized protein (TIGR03790 family)
MRWKVYACILSLSFLLPRAVWGGGSGFNVAIVVNQSSSNSLELGNYYAERRGVPPQNLIRMDWPGAPTEWTYQSFSNALLEVVRSALVSRQLTNQVDYLILSMDIPYRVIDGATVNSTTSALYYGFKEDGPAPGPGAPDSCSLPSASASAYAGSELPFRSVSPGNISPTNLLVMMITASNLGLAKLTVDQGAVSDGTFPSAPVYLAKGPDYARNIRYALADNAVFENRVQGALTMERTEATGPAGFGTILGFQSGAYAYGVSGASFVPGGFADNLTSYGGILFQDNSSQLNLLALLAAGASGSYGTVVEPCAYLEKFPSPMAYFYQARGFNLAESYYQSLTNPYQGILVGEPLAAPFAKVGHGSWTLPGTPQATLSGNASLAAEFTAADPSRPLQQVDLFLDGQWIQTLTNVSPSQNNGLAVTLNGVEHIYTVPQNASLKTIAAGIAATINQKSGQTKIKAVAFGDRIQLVHNDPSVPAAQIGTFPSSAAGSVAALTTFLNASRTNFLDSTAYGIRELTVAGEVVVGDYLSLTVIRTNGALVQLGVTNSTAGTTLLEFTQRLLNLANNPDTGLQGVDGVTGQDLQDPTQGATSQIAFALRANAPGWAASQIQARLEGSFTITPLNQAPLNRNVDDLKHRNHLYISAGLGTLTAAATFNTALHPDGPHRLTAIAYEGTSVRTQTRTDTSIQISNNTWKAVLSPLLAGSNSAVSATLQFRVTASIATISNIELFTTGGLVASASGVNEATFNIAGNSLGVGAHEFYAVVTSNNGQRYRTSVVPVRLVTTAPPVRLVLSTPPPTLSWAAVAGRQYQVLGADNLPGPYTLQATVLPTNSAAEWTDPLPSSSRFYRVKVP